MDSSCAAIGDDAGAAMYVDIVDDRERIKVCASLFGRSCRRG